MIVNFLGRTHMLLLHLPIGILLLALLLEWLNYLQWVKTDRKILNFTFATGTFVALFSCITGYLLFKNGDYPFDLANNHKWAGILTTVAAGLSFWFSKKNNQKALLASSFMLMIGLGITGHLGGSITHGEDFLAFGASEEVEVLGPVYEFSNAEQAEIYNDIVVPLLESKCISCHGPNKIKGKLRLDSPEALQAGGKSRKNILGDRKSEMLRRIILPISDSKHMPPKKKLQITEDELEFLKWWIQNGASFDAKINDIEDHEQMIKVINKMKEAQPSLASNDLNVSAYVPDVEVGMPPTAVINALQKSDVVVLSAGNSTSFLEVNFVNVKEVTSDQLSNLKLLAPYIVRLKLSNLALGDSELAILEGFDNLVRLYLDGTEITDQTLSKMANKKHIKYLNLNNTEISDVGISQLDSLGNDVKIYASNTKVKLDSLRNGAKIIKGKFVLEQLESDTSRISEN